MIVPKLKDTKLSGEIIKKKKIYIYKRIKERKIDRNQVRR